MTKLPQLLLTSFIFLIFTSTDITLAGSFNQAKTLLPKIYQQLEQSKTFYCGCNFTTDKKIASKGCNFKTTQYQNRQSKLEWEHIVPASRLGSHLQCWKEGAPQCVTKKGKYYKGRRCCRKVSQQFRNAEGDLLNLVPAIGALNAIRSNYSMGDIAGEARHYGQCDIEINSETKTIEPPHAQRGDVARIYFYMAQKYDIKLTEKEKILFKIWDQADPIDKTEQRRKKITQKYSMK